jgi:hypothetical protein
MPFYAEARDGKANFLIFNFSSTAKPAFKRQVQHRKKWVGLHGRTKGEIPRRLGFAMECGICEIDLSDRRRTRRVRSGQLFIAPNGKGYHVGFFTKKIFASTPKRSILPALEHSL